MLKTRLLLSLSLLAAFVCVGAYAEDAPKATFTKLTVSPHQVEIGAAVTLTAQVTSESIPVQHGSVVFCDANSIRCEGSSVLGRAQLTQNGKASLKLTLGAGTYAITASFEGTRHSAPALAASTSTAQSLTIKSTPKTSSTQGSMRQ